MRHFDYDRDGVLCAEEVSCVEIARAAGTPAYVYARATIERHFRVYDEAFAAHPHLVCYAMKANPSGAILSLVARMGGGADIVSAGELARAVRAGIPASRIVFSGVGKTEGEMAAALDAGILAFNVESEPELRALGRVAAEKRVVAPVSLRVNPDIDARTHPYIATGLAESKFGIPLADARRIAADLAGHRSLALIGLDCHIGSQLTTLSPLVEALEAVLRLADELAAHGHAIHHVDLGGGLGIPYKGETPPLPRELGDAVVARMRGRKERLIVEPGRVIVGNAGVLLTRVLYVKKTAARTFVIVDAAMNDLIRPSLYGAHHDIWPVVKRGGAPEGPVDVVGPVCESSDRFAKDRVMPAVQEGDLLAIMSAGAYGFSMASTYNSRPLPAEVMVSGARTEVVRARQTAEDLMTGERIPEWDAPGGDRT